MTTDKTTPEMLWQANTQAMTKTNLAKFAEWLHLHRNLELEGSDWQSIYQWSISDLEAFWSALAQYQGVMFHDAPTAALGKRQMPGTEWFPGATLNYAEHVLTAAPGRQDDDIAIEFFREDGLEQSVTHAQLRDQVARARVGLIDAGVKQGDRVAILAPNCPETLVAFLATASLGAICSVCSPDFGVSAVRDRFSQIEPTVFIAVDGYKYAGKSHDIRERVQTLSKELGSIKQTVLIPYLDSSAQLPNTTSWSDFIATAKPLEFTPVSFDHPLWILYSSGTTGLPKGIVQGHGGILLEHFKTVHLEMDLRPSDRFFWFTTTGWMMWNFLIGSLLSGVTVIMYDGSPGHPSLDILWSLAEKYRIRAFGISAPYIQSCIKADLTPNEKFDLSSIQEVYSTGSPLSEDGFYWIQKAIGSHIQIGSVSGGTDICSTFVGSSPLVPVWLGELSCASLGVDVRAFDEQGNDVLEEVGELVVTTPMPSMPVSFWNDPDGSRLKEAYFDFYPGVWRHGDWIRRTDRGSYVIYGRSDSTLNRGGVRMGTADFYAIVEAFEGVSDALIIDTTRLDAKQEGELLCFLVLQGDTKLSEVEPELRKALRQELSPRHVPNQFIVVDAIPRTLNGKKCEIPIKKILTGTSPEKAISTDALKNPESLNAFIEIAANKAKL